MKLLNSYKDAEARDYPSDQAKGAIGRVVIGKADGDTRFCMRVFEIDPGGNSFKHSHEYEHQVFIHSGRGQAWNGQEWMDIGPESVMYIPGGVEHQLRNNGSELLVFVCCVPEGAPEL